MVAIPFLAKFARLVLGSDSESGTSGSDQNVKEKSQSRLLSTIVTKVDRETTDDR